MIFENAFSFLPEILVGRGFLRKRYEASIVNAFSLAVLQSLNARNLPNPLSAIEVEKAYDRFGFKSAKSAVTCRHPRADLFVNICNAGVASQGLSLFGWRHYNWLEAKFFRRNEDGEPKVPSTNAVLSVAEDLFRLCALINFSAPQRTENIHGGLTKKTTANISSGRYFLHVYEGNPEDFLGIKSVAHKQWLTDIRAFGMQNITISIAPFIKRSKNFKKDFPPPLDQLTLNAKIKNFSFEQEEKTDNSAITCILTRLVSFKITMGNLILEEDENRNRIEISPNSGYSIRDAIGGLMGIGTKSKEKDIPVSPDEITQFEEEFSNSYSNTGTV